MASLKLLNHLKFRDLDITTNRCLLNEENDEVYFLLWNLSGQLQGYQKYFFEGVKIHDSNKAAREGILAKYFTWVTKVDRRVEVAVYGLETYKWDGKYLFITEGIFDIIKIHNLGEPGIATLMNDPPKSYKGWLKTIPQKKIVIYDNDKAGEKLAELGDYAFTVPSPYKDLGDMPQNEVAVFIKNILKNL